jgi:type II secretory pathway pseudopilin PulG
MRNWNRVRTRRLAAQRVPAHPGGAPRAARRGRDAGESLVEIVLTVMIVGVTITALVSGLATVSAAGDAHRQGVRADTVMRNYAEAAKSAARLCVVGGTWTPAFTAPDGFTVAMDPTSTSCPAVSQTRRVTLSVVSPNGVRDEMTIVVRTP